MCTSWALIQAQFPELVISQILSACTPGASSGLSPSVTSETELTVVMQPDPLPLAALVGVAARKSAGSIPDANTPPNASSASTATPPMTQSVRLDKPSPLCATVLVGRIGSADPPG